MEACIPAPVQPLIDAYLHALEPLRAHFCGIYLYGSIALGAFEEPESDIDVIALTRGELTARELAHLRALHAELMRTHQLARRLEVLYIPVRQLGKLDREIAPYPAVRHGDFSPAGYANLNSITWWTVKNRGIPLFGPERSALAVEIPWQDVLHTMRESLDGFWVSRVRRPYLFPDGALQAQLGTGGEEGGPLQTERLLIAHKRAVLRRPLEKWRALVHLRDALLLLRDDWFVFAVVTHCRMLSTIEEGEIVAKSVALKRWRGRLPAHWRPLIDEAWRIRHHLGGPSLYRSRMVRALGVLAFIRYVRKRGGNVLEALLRGERSAHDPQASVSPSVSLVRK